MTNCFNRAIGNPEANPQWFTQGIRYLLPKSNETNITKNYRLIACLSTMYKILTSIVTERTCNFFGANNILPSEQKVCKKESYGCKDQLSINKMLLENRSFCHRNLSTAWVDYRKAFDNVSHTWIFKVLQTYKISLTITNFLTTSMKKWKTNLSLNHLQGRTVCENIKIKCGIFRGDSLSPLLFCLTLVPLSYELENMEYGYNINGEEINHLFYMDDLKTVKAFSDTYA